MARTTSTVHAEVFGGVDTHRDTHHAAVVDAIGRHLADAAFPATGHGYRQLLDWLCRQGVVKAVGVEGTGSYGAALVRVLRAHALQVVEVDRPDRKARRRRGKSDPIDAYAAAEAVASGRASGTPKTRDGRVESIRLLRVTRNGAVKARTQAINQLRDMLVTAPAQLREQLRHLSTAALVDRCAHLRPAADLADPAAAVKAAMRRLARRHQALSTEIRELDHELRTLVCDVAPRLVELPGVGIEIAGQMLVTAGDNPERLRSEASFAHLCGVAPIPASSGRTDRHRLNRGGDRQANKALHLAVVTRLRCDAKTQRYVQRRQREGLSKSDIIRCLKRYIAREIYYRVTDPTLRPPASAAT